jgi:hypothetical protein
MIYVPIDQLDRTGGDVAAIVECYAPDRIVRSEGAWQERFLRSAWTGSAGVVVCVVGYRPYLPRVGTSPAVVDTREGVRPRAAQRVATEHSRARELLTLSAGDQAREVLASLSLNRSQLAEILRIARPTLYDWLDGREPNAANSDRLLVLLRLLARAGVSSSDPLPPRFVRHPLNDEGVSLLDLLRSEDLDEERALALLGEARALVREMDSRRNEREERLRDLGFEEPSAEERKAQLANSVAGRDWPKT